MTVAKLLRGLAGAALVAAVFVGTVGLLGVVASTPAVGMLAPFAAAAVALAVLAAAAPVRDRVVGRISPRPRSTPYAALAQAAERIRVGSVPDALPGLVRILAEGTGAAHAAVWLAVDDSLVAAAIHPPAVDGDPPRAASAAVLLTRPEVDHAVPVLEGPVLRAVLSIGKPARAVTVGDRRLMEDLAHGAGLLLRGVALNTELEQRVRRADELAEQRRAAQARLRHARDVERRRLVTELAAVTTDRLGALRTDIVTARSCLEPDPAAGGPEPAARAGEAITHAATGLDELLERFRVIVRGVYPAVLRDQGPRAALEEVAADLPRPVRLDGDLGRRLAWEVESGIYYATAAAITLWGSHPVEQPLQVHLELSAERLVVRVHDPVPVAAVDDSRAALRDDADRLSALGGALELGPDDTGAMTVHAWLPTELEPWVDPGRRTP